MKYVKNQIKKTRCKTRLWILDRNPELSAVYLSDNYLTESLRNATKILLTNVFILHGLSVSIFKVTLKHRGLDTILDNVFMNNPVYSVVKENKALSAYARTPLFNDFTVKWSRLSGKHLKFVLDFALACNKEYTRRLNQTSREQDILSLIANDSLLNNKINPLGESSSSTLNKFEFELAQQTIPVTYRLRTKKDNKFDTFSAMRLFYKTVIENPFIEYATSKTNIPEFLLENSKFE